MVDAPPSASEGHLFMLVFPQGGGERLDRFELIAELASGGMATVYLARLGGMGGFQRLFAIKRLHPHLASDGEFIQMFLDEARLAARIHHPNVVPIHEIGTTASGYYLVMDYVEGDTAARLLARAAHGQVKVPAGVGIRILLDAMAGLHAAHELKDDQGQPLEIVHRDVSPQNILVGVDGIARITDFGVARAATRLSTTRSGQLKGKLAYMAPEQARSGAIDRRADVFALGICLWETLAGKRLFKGDGEADTLNRVLYQPIPSLRSAAPTIPDALHAVCMKALERDPDRRFATVLELSDALEAAAQSLKSLATKRDVIACVESVLGQEVAQQREIVRTYLARAEANGAHDGRPRSTPPPRSESVTKIERIERAAQSNTPPAVSSVSSAVLQVIPPPSSTGRISAMLPPDAPPSPAPRAKRWLVRTMLAAGGLALMVLAPFVRRAPVAPVVSPAAVVAPPAMAPHAVAMPIAPSAAPAAAKPASDASIAQPAPVVASPPVRRPPATKARSGGSGVAPSSVGRAGSFAPPPSPAASPPSPPAADVAPAEAATVPDDITHNPYR